MFSFITKYFSPPIFPNDDEKTRQAQQSRFIIISELVVFISFAILLPIIVPELTYRIILLIPFIVLLLCLLPILRRGMVRFTGIAMLVGLWATLTVTAVTAGGLESPAFHLYFVVVLCAGLLFGLRAAVVSAGLLVLTGVTIFYAEANNLLPGLLTTGLSIRIWVIFDFGVYFITIVMSLAIRNMNKALDNTRREIAERKRAEEDLRASEERFQGLSDAAFEGVMIHDKGVILDANSAFVELFGFSSPEDIIGKNGLEFLPFTPESRETLRNIIPINSSRRYEIQVMRSDGTTFSAETQGREVKYRGHKARVIVMRDITERMRADQEQHRRLAELEAFNKISISLRVAQNINEMLPTLLNEILTLIDARDGLVWLYDSAGDQMRESAARGCFQEIVEDPLNPHDGIMEQVLTSGEAYIAREFKTDPRTREPVRLKIPLGYGGASVPIRSSEGLLGVLFVSVQLPRELVSEEVHLLTALGEIAGNAIHRMRLHNSLEETFIQTVAALAHAMDARDAYTAGHSERSAQFALLLAEKLGLSKEERQILNLGALLHDIGKIGVPDAVLHKTRKLTEEEWALIKAHPFIGAQIIEPIRQMKNVVPIVLHHQERFDGTGYPDGLAGEAIPLAARILSVVDAYSSMSDDRTYRKALSHQQAIAQIRKNSGTQFDPKIVEVFLRIVEREKPDDI